MKTRWAAVLALGFALVATGTPVRAETAAEKVARQRDATRAKIACSRAAARGQRCDAQTARVAAGVAPAPTTRSRSTAPSRASAPGGGSTGGSKSIVISINEQILRAYEGDDLVLATPVSTGARGTETPTGRYKIRSKEQRHWSTKFHVWMPYAMQVVGGIFIHELPFTRDGQRIGVRSLGSAVSHGCIRVGIGDAEALYNWTTVGTPVLIR